MITITVQYKFTSHDLPIDAATEIQAEVSECPNGIGSMGGGRKERGRGRTIVLIMPR